MLSKQAVLEAVQRLPDSASFAEITDAFLRLAVREGTISDYARLYRKQLTPENIAEYLRPKFDVDLDTVLADLEALHAAQGPK